MAGLFLECTCMLGRATLFVLSFVNDRHDGVLSLSLATDFLPCRLDFVVCVLRFGLAALQPLDSWRFGIGLAQPPGFIV